MAKPRDIASIVAGALLAAFGVVLLLDASGDVNLRFSGLAPMALLLIGGPLLASGLTRRG